MDKVFRIWSSYVSLLSFYIKIISVWYSLTRRSSLSVATWASKSFYVAQFWAMRSLEKKMPRRRTTCKVHLDDLVEVFYWLCCWGCWMRVVSCISTNLNLFFGKSWSSSLEKCEKDLCLISLAWCGLRRSWGFRLCRDDSELEFCCNYVNGYKEGYPDMYLKLALFKQLTL